MAFFGSWLRRFSFCVGFRTVVFSCVFTWFFMRIVVRGFRICVLTIDISKGFIFRLGYIYRVWRDISFGGYYVILYVTKFLGTEALVLVVGSFEY